MKNTILIVSQLVTPFEMIRNSVLAWDHNGHIVYAGPGTDISGLSGEVLDNPDLIAIPGLIDIHVHGGWGVEFGSGNLLENLRTYSLKVASKGVTGFLITVSGPNPEIISEILATYSQYLSEDFEGAQPLGFHLEGPFLNPDRHGAFDPAWLRQPTIPELQRYLKAAYGWIRQISLAPELDNAQKVASFLNENGIRVALAHSSADYETARSALANGFTHVTHTFNAQSPFHHRKPGVIGAVLASDGCTAEIIADTVHVHPGAIKVLLRCLGTERVVMITDAMPGAGLPDGKYELIGQEVTVKDGKALLKDGTLAGSTATMDQCLKNMVTKVGVSLADACRMGAYNPAGVINMQTAIGSLTQGKNADFALIDNDFNIRAVYKNGRCIYSR